MVSEIPCVHHCPHAMQDGAAIHKFYKDTSAERFRLTWTKGEASTKLIKTAWRLLSIALGTGKPRRSRAAINADSFTAASRERYNQLQQSCHQKIYLLAGSAMLHAHAMKPTISLCITSKSEGWKYFHCKSIGC